RRGENFLDHRPDEMRARDERRHPTRPGVGVHHPVRLHDDARGISDDAPERPASRRGPSQRVADPDERGAERALALVARADRPDAGIGPHAHRDPGLAISLTTKRRLRAAVVGMVSTTSSVTGTPGTLAVTTSMISRSLTRLKRSYGTTRTRTL